MAFKALNLKVASELELEGSHIMSAVQAAMFVFIFQSLLIWFIFEYILTPDV